MQLDQEASSTRAERKKRETAERLSKKAVEDKVPSPGAKMPCTHDTRYMPCVPSLLHTLVACREH